MDQNSFSPPKTQRQALQPLTFSEANASNQRNRNSIKKKLQIEQENINPLYNIPYPQSSKCKTNYFNPSSMLPLISEIAALTVAQKNLSTLPLEIHIEILKFISPEELINTIPFLNKHWYKASHDPLLWNIIDQSQKLMVDVKYLKQKCIVERRSRGKLFKAISRVNKESFTIRRINLAVSNGGHDDGIPTSMLREISYLTNLHHKNISKITEVEINKEILQICSEYQDYNLKEYMKHFLVSSRSEKSRAFGTRAITASNFVEYKMPLKKIKIIAYQVLQGLNYLHHQGIIHRNLKADNVLVNENGTVKVSDFALSKFITLPHTPYTPEDPKDRERSGREARRLWYRAPELLLRKKKYSFETDIWAFGCILAETALNEPLFNGETEIEQLFKMFGLTGSPNTSNWGTVCDEEQYKMIFPKWESVYFPYICCPKNSQEFKQVYKVFAPNREKALKKLESLGAVLGYEGLDLLWNCLSLNPQLRSNANTLLNHAFFDDIRNEMQLRYTDLSHCANKSCNTSGFYTPVTTPECHLISIFNTIKGCEESLRPGATYLDDQSALTEHMRCILIDWLIDVSMHFDFLDETLHLAVNYIDRTLTKVKLDKTKLQLVGVTCLKIADVLHERSKEYYKQDNAKEYAYITADEYNPQQLIDMEKDILNLLGFNLVAPNAMHFLKIYIALFQIPDNVAVIACFLTDLMLLSYHIMEFEYSLIASSALFLACMCQNFKIDENILNENRQFVDCYKQEKFRRCVANMKDLWVTITTTTLFASFDAVYSKYQNKYSFCGKSLNPPAYTAFNIQNWFYSK